MGYKDWQEIVEWIGDAIYSQEALAVGAAPTVDGPFQLGNFRSILVAARAITNRALIQITYRPKGAPAGLTNVFEGTVSTAPSYWIIPCYGNVIDEISITRAANPCTVDLIVLGTNHEGHIGLSTSGLSILSGEAVTVPAGGGTVVQSTTRAYMGRARLHWTCVNAALAARAALSIMDITQQDYLNTSFSRLYRADGLTGEDAELLLVPRPIAVTMVNNAAANVVVFYSLIAESR